MSGTMGASQFSHDPTNLDDPSHPFRPLGTGFELVRQRRQAHDARQQMLAQMLAAPPVAEPAGGGGIAPLPASGWGGSSSGSGGFGLSGLADAVKQANQPKPEWNAKLGQYVDANQGPGWFSDLFRQGGMKTPEVGGGGFGGGGV
jgi:hypothetical protein